MEVVSRPTKEQVRMWFESRRRTLAPLPSNAQIRRQLGWGLCNSADRRADKGAT